MPKEKEETPFSCYYRNPIRFQTMKTPFVSNISMRISIRSTSSGRGYNARYVAKMPSPPTNQVKERTVMAAMPMANLSPWR